MAYQKRRFLPDFSIIVAMFLLPSTCYSLNEFMNFSTPVDWKNAKSVYEFLVTDNYGRKMTLEKYRGQVLMIVNINYNLKNHFFQIDELNQINTEYGVRGLKILAFPYDVFDEWDPDFKVSPRLLSQYDVEFDVFEKTMVNGDDAHPLWKYLKNTFMNNIDEIQEPFTRFIINRHGIPVERISVHTPLQEYPKYLRLLDY